MEDWKNQVRERACGRRSAGLARGWGPEASGSIGNKKFAGHDGARRGTRRGAGLSGLLFVIVDRTAEAASGRHGSFRALGLGLRALALPIFRSGAGAFRPGLALALAAFDCDEVLSNVLEPRVTVSRWVCGFLRGPVGLMRGLWL
jgi:hypothetical protein